MSRWRITSLGDLVSLQRGYDLPETRRTPGSIPVYGSFGITGWHNKARAKGPGVTIGRSGASFGVVNFCPIDYWPHNTVLFVTDFKGNDERYISYLLKSLDFSFLNSGSAQPSLNRNYIYPLTVRVPDPNAQCRIASILSAYDDLIENNTRRIAILEEMARALYQEWFVHFRFPGHEHVPLAPSPLGPIPEGWRVGKLEQYVELAYGKALKADDREEGPFPVYGSSGIVGYHSSSLVDGPGIIVGRKGNVGSVHWSDQSFYPIDTVYYVRSELPLHYVYFNLKRQNFINNDAAVPGLNRKQAYSLPFLAPADELLTRFQEMCEAFFRFHQNLRLRNENLRTTRDLLLPKLISGEIDVSALEAPIAEAAD